MINCCHSYSFFLLSCTRHFVNFYNHLQLSSCIIAEKYYNHQLLLSSDSVADIYQGVKFSSFQFNSAVTVFKFHVL